MTNCFIKIFPSQIKEMLLASREISIGFSADGFSYSLFLSKNKRS